jgi:hypothetical protein
MMFRRRLGVMNGNITHFCRIGCKAVNGRASSPVNVYREDETDLMVKRAHSATRKDSQEAVKAAFQRADVFVETAAHIYPS